MVTYIFSSLIAFTCINNVGRFNIYFTHYKEDNDVSKADEILQDELIKHTTRPSNTLFVMLMICKLDRKLQIRSQSLAISQFNFKPAFKRVFFQMDFFLL